MSGPRIVGGDPPEPRAAEVVWQGQSSPQSPPVRVVRCGNYPHRCTYEFHVETQLLDCMGQPTWCALIAIPPQLVQMALSTLGEQIAATKPRGDA